MTCSEARDLFSALVDGALTAEERRALGAHLGACADCRRELERFRGVVGLVRDMAPARAPAGFVARVLAAARPVPWHRRLVRAAFVPLRVKLPLEAAAIVLVSVTLALLSRQPQEVPQAARLGRAPTAPVRVERDAAGSPGARSARQAPVGATEEPAPAQKDAPGAKEAGRGEREAVQAPRAGDEAKAHVRAADRAGPVEERAEVGEQRAAEARREPVAPPLATRQTAPASAATGRLAVADQAAAAREVAALTGRLAGRIVGRRADAEALVLELEIPSATWPALVRELPRLGRFTAGPLPDPRPDPLRVELRIVRGAR